MMMRDVEGAVAAELPVLPPTWAILKMFRHTGMHINPGLMSRPDFGGVRPIPNKPGLPLRKF